MALTALGLLASAVIVGRATAARRADVRRRAALVSELRRLDAAQTAWAARHGDYARDAAQLADAGPNAFTATPGTRLEFESLRAGEWAAVASSDVPVVAPSHCGIFRGSAAASPHRAVTRPGEVVCW